MKLNYLFIYLYLQKNKEWIEIEVTREFLINEYVNKLKSINEIHEEFNIPKKKIRKELEINNIKILSKQDRVMIKYKDIVIKEYLNNKSLTEISKKYHIAPNTIKNILISENVEILNSDQMSSIKNNERRRENRKYQVNFD